MSSFEFCGGELFAGANSQEGFVSFYCDIFEREQIERIYILKGGPGTGKSSFMKRAAALCEERGCGVERYCCSSDPESLDAVIIDGRTVILDGTAPHSMEAVRPGVRDEIIDLGAFWDAERLSEEYERICELADKKKECYARAYKYLEAYGNVRNINSALILPCVNLKKAERAAQRIYDGIYRGGGFSATPGLIDSVGMKGRRRLDTYESFASRVYVIDDCFDTAHLFLRMLVCLAERTDTPVRISYDPVDTSRVNALYFSNDKTAVVVVGEGCEIDGEKINMKRFICPSAAQVRREYRANRKLCQALMASAVECFENAGKYHFELEKIYSGCMDFEAQNKFIDAFLKTKLI